MTDVNITLSHSPPLSSWLPYHHFRTSGLGCGHLKVTLVAAWYHYRRGLFPTVISALQVSPICLTL